MLLPALARARQPKRYAGLIAPVAGLFWLLRACGGWAAPEAFAQPPAEQPGAPLWVIQQSDLCTSALRRSEQRYHLPPALLQSIAKVESGRPITSPDDVRPWPWAIDADGTGLYFDSKVAAIAWMRDHAASHSFVDVGCMQVDLHYHPEAFASMDDAFDPEANADYAARLLVALHDGEAGGSWDAAVGLYHSHSALLAAEYRDRVAMLGSDIWHGTLKGVPLYVRAIRLGTLRLPLAGGRATLINVNRQPVRRSRHPFTTCQIERILGPYLSAGGRGAACEAGVH
jgi:hypothetical protein